MLSFMLKPCQRGFVLSTVFWVNKGTVSLEMPLKCALIALLRDGQQEAPEASAAAAGEQPGGGGSATSNWVQCASCSQWRVVPLAHWPSVQSASNQDWVCKVRLIAVLQQGTSALPCACGNISAQRITRG